MEQFAQNYLKLDKSVINVNMLKNIQHGPDSGFIAAILLQQTYNQNSYLLQLQACLTLAEDPSLSQTIRISLMEQFLRIFQRVSPDQMKSGWQNLGELLSQFADVFVRAEFGPEENSQKLVQRAKSIVENIFRAHSTFNIALYLAKFGCSMPGLREMQCPIFDCSFEELEIFIQIRKFESECQKSAKQTGGRKVELPVDIQQLCYALTETCKMCLERYPNIGAGDPLRIQIFYTTITLLNFALNAEHMELLPHVDYYLHTYVSLFSDNQKRTILESYSKLCEKLQYEEKGHIKEAYALQNTQEPKKKPIKNKPAGSKYGATITEIRSNISGLIEAGEFVQRKDVNSAVVAAKKAGNEETITNEVIELLSQEQHSKGSDIAWKLIIN